MIIGSIVLVFTWFRTNERWFGWQFLVLNPRTNPSLLVGAANIEHIWCWNQLHRSAPILRRDVFIHASRPKTKEQFQSVNICLQSSFAFFYVNFLCLLVKDNDKFLNQPTARSLLSNAKPRLHFYISIILVLHQFLLFFAKMHGYIISTSKNQCSCDVRLPSI